MNKDEILTIIENSVSEIENKINLYEKYKNKDKKIKRLQKIVYGLECFLPYLIASLISTKVLSDSNHSIYTLDEVKYYENVQETICSNGFTLKKSSNTTKNFSESFFTSTAWIKDEFGNYMREEVYYNMEAINDYEVEELLSMSEEEIKSLFPIVNKKKYVKNSLKEEDLIYNENLVAFVKTYKEFDEQYDYKQTVAGNMFDIFICLMSTIISGMIFSKLLIRHRISGKMKLSFEETVKINVDEYQTLLKIRQDNLNMLLSEDEKKLKRGSKKYGLFHFTK